MTELRRPRFVLKCHRVCYCTLDLELLKWDDKRQLEANVKTQQISQHRVAGVGRDA